MPHLKCHAFLLSHGVASGDGLIGEYQTRSLSPFGTILKGHTSPRKPGFTLSHLRIPSLLLPYFILGDIVAPKQTMTVLHFQEGGIHLSNECLHETNLLF